MNFKARMMNCYQLSRRLRLVRLRMKLWMMVAIASFKLPWMCGVEREAAQARLMVALTKVNLVYWFELAHEITDDLPYWFY